MWRDCPSRLKDSQVSVPVSCGRRGNTPGCCSAKEQNRHTGLSWRLWSRGQEGARLFFQQKTIVTNVSRESSGWRPGCALSWGDCPITAAEAPRPISQGAELGSWGTLKQEPRGIHCPLLLAPATYNHLHATYMPGSPSGPWGQKLPPHPIR